MLLNNPFSEAANKARQAGLCPILLLDEFYTNHWDIETLCSELTCIECLGVSEKHLPPISLMADQQENDEEEGVLEIPF